MIDFNSKMIMKGNNISNYEVTPHSTQYYPEKLGKHLKDLTMLGSDIKRLNNEHKIAKTNFEKMKILM